MRASSKCFITDERHLGRGWRMNLVWHHLQGKAGIAADTSSTTHAVARIADRDMMLSGLNITSATSAAEVEGGKTYAVVASTVNAVCLESNTLTNGSPWTEFDWDTDQEIEWECHLRVDDALTDRFFKCGLGLIPSTVDLTTDDDYVGFWAQDDGAVDFVYNVGGGTDVAVASLFTALAGDTIHLAIKFDAQQYFTGYINGVPVQAAPKTFQGNRTAALLPFIATLEDTSGAADPKISVYGMSMSKRIE